MTLPAMVVLALALQGPASPRVLDGGDQSNVDAARQVVVRTTAEWDSLWRLHAPERTRPIVDFANEMVVGVFLGSRPTAGFTVAVVSVGDDPTAPGGTLVRYRQSMPKSGAIAAQVITSAFQLVAVPAKTSAVRFERVSE